MIRSFKVTSYKQFCFNWSLISDEIATLLQQSRSLCACTRSTEAVDNLRTRWLHISY